MGQIISRTAAVCVLNKTSEPSEENRHDIRCRKDDLHHRLFQRHGPDSGQDAGRPRTPPTSSCLIALRARRWNTYLEARGGCRTSALASYALNVADHDMVIAAVGTAVGACGLPDVVINMAGIGGAAELIDMPFFETFDRIVQVNLYGSRNGWSRRCCRRCSRRGSGKIVLVGSMGGIVPVYGYTAFSRRFKVCSRGPLPQCLRYSLEPRGLSVACFCPGESGNPWFGGRAQDAAPGYRGV